MTSEPRQLVFDLAHRQALGLEDFLVSGSNSAAVDLIDRWPDWPHAAAVVTGPSGSGKSHLAHVWQLRSGAQMIDAALLSEQRAADVQSSAALVVENVDRGIASEQALFHLLNLARETKLALLLTSASEPGAIETSIPDLRSRLRALPLARMEPPDDALLSGVLVKLFTDRQLIVEPAVVTYIMQRMERSMATAQKVVGEIDRLALALQRRVTKPVAASALESVGNPVD